MLSSRGDNTEDEVVISYHDCLLRNHDVNLLRGPHWLNDALIGFYFEYLEHKYNDSVEKKPEVLFVSPELTQLLKLTETKDYDDFLGPLNAKDRNYVLFPLNDCESRDAAGGTHWSLLVYSKVDETAFHLDSCRGSNRQAAFQFAKKIMSYLLDSNDKGSVQETNCPQQENGYDCGLFALCITDIVLNHIGKVPQVKGCNFDGAKSLVRTKRAELLNLISELKK